MGLFQKTVKPDTPCVLSLPVGDISPNPNQPRRVFSPAELDELALSIREVGILQPLTVRRGEHGWELIAGERRLRAAALAGLAHVPCLAVEADDDRSTLLALVENVQRQDLDFWEEALALDKLMSVCGLSQSEAAKKLGKSQSAIANKLRLLQHSPAVLQKLRAASLTERHARALLRLPEESQRLSVIDRITVQQLSVAQTEALIARMLTAPPPRKNRLPGLGKDLRLFFNAVEHNLSLIRSAGFAADTQRQETEQEIILTIRIPRQAAGYQKTEPRDSKI